MELSTVDSALRSLLRRENVPVSIIDCTKRLMEKPSAEDHVASIPIYLETLEKPRWDVLAVGLVLAQYYATTLSNQSDILRLVVQACHANLEHLEPRIRRLVGKVLGALCAIQGPSLFDEFRAELMEIVECNIARSPEFEEINEEEYFSYFDMSIPLASPLSTPTSPHRLDDISGFKCLETSLLTIKYMVVGLGPLFVGPLEANNFAFFHSIIVRSVKHCNRHVRNVGFETIHSLNKSVLPPLFFSQNQAFGHAVVDCLVRGLQDPWSEVRLTASQATRSFLLNCTPEEREMFYSKLVPRMCLNRHYVADGVKSYSRDTWTKVMGEGGRHIVARYAAECVACYVDATDADNPFVREAACICIGEIVIRVDAEAIRPHVNDLLTAARICLQDDVFTVSDAACGATSQVVLAFPTESRGSLDKLIRWWTVHLSDEVWSVREDAAIALGSCLRAYPNDDVLRKRIVEIARTFLLKAKDQPAMSQAAYDALLKSEQAHSNKQRYSCCSFEPRQLKRTDHDLCTDHDPAGGHALWAHTDGAIYLVRELCVGIETQNDAIELFPSLVDAAILRHFPQTGVIQETLWKQLPAIGQLLGKKMFKRHIELFFDPLALTLQGTHRLARFAAIECIKQLSQLIGPMIFRGRLEHNQLWKSELEPHLDPQPVNIDGNGIEVSTEEGLASDYLKCTFDRVFSPKSTQENVYEATAKSLVLDLLDGYNCTIFAYGQTGSGKTHTIYGPKDGLALKPEDQGLINRLVHDLYHHISQKQTSQKTYDISGSFMEIYMEQINDLLHPANKNLKVRECTNKSVFVDELQSVRAPTKESMLKLVEHGNTNRVVACTRMNNDSSRSHTVLMINMTQKNLLTATEMNATMYVVDLAGSEMVNKTLATGKTLNEAKAINKSLSALSNVIKALVEQKKHIPFRDSKLTRILQDSLGGSAKTCLIVTVSSSSYNVAETISTLRFGMRAKEIKNEPVLHESKANCDYQQMYQNLLIEHATTQERLRTLEEITKTKETSTRITETVQSISDGMEPISTPKEKLSIPKTANPSQTVPTISACVAKVANDLKSPVKRVLDKSPVKRSKLQGSADAAKHKPPPLKASKSLPNSPPIQGKISRTLTSLLFTDEAVPHESVDVLESKLMKCQDELQLCRSENEALREINQVLSAQNNVFTNRTQELEGSMTMHQSALDALKEINRTICAQNTALSDRNQELEGMLEDSQVKSRLPPTVPETESNPSSEIDSLTKQVVEMKLHVHYVTEYTKSILDHEPFELVRQLTQLKLENERLKYEEQHHADTIKELRSKCQAMIEAVSKKDDNTTSLQRTIQEYQALYKEQVRLSQDRQQTLVKEVEYYKMIWQRVAPSKKEATNDNLSDNQQVPREKEIIPQQQHSLFKASSFCGAVPTEPLSLMSLKRAPRPIVKPGMNGCGSAPQSPINMKKSKNEETDPLSSVFDQEVALL